MYAARRKRIGSDNTWPGFVDALSSMLLVIVFLLSIFALAQFFLGQALSGRDEALERLNNQVAELGNLLRLEQQANSDLRRSISGLSASLQSSKLDREQMADQLAATKIALDEAEARLTRARKAGVTADEALKGMRQAFAAKDEELEAERQLTASARAQVDRLNQNILALRQQLARIEAVLQASELRDKEQGAVIADLGRRLNVALAGKVEELARYRSEFFGRLREVLGARPDIRVEGDRFVFQAELLFSSGSADLGEAGKEELRTFASTLIEISRTIPPDLDWVLRVDGHTDAVPISTARFPSNWELSTARAISVVRFLVGEGIRPDRLAATGFAEFRPIMPGQTPDAYRLNRRIELRLTQR
ncbi:MAG: peptidoglycan -binding protein [Sphingomonadales bacterium]